jgi:hypothetical protein
VGLYRGKWGRHSLSGQKFFEGETERKKKKKKEEEKKILSSPGFLAFSV